MECSKIASSCATFCCSSTESTAGNGNDASAYTLRSNLRGVGNAHPSNKSGLELELDLRALFMSQKCLSEAQFTERLQAIYDQNRDRITRPLMARALYGRTVEEGLLLQGWNDSKWALFHRLGMTDWQTASAWKKHEGITGFAEHFDERDCGDQLQTYRF